ncbi:MAG: Holliday junction resolvase RuvX [Candidatus Zixiibacteriota bacterium]
MSRTLGIDYGEKRIGLAISDPLGIIAQSLPTLILSKNQDILSELKNLIGEYEISTMVLGLPKNMDGTLGEVGKKVMEFGKELSQKINIKVEFWDERLSSVESLKILRDEKRKIKRKKDLVDKISASLILQGYLDRKNSEALLDEN